MVGDFGCCYCGLSDSEVYVGGHSGYCASPWFLVRRLARDPHPRPSPGEGVLMDVFIFYFLF